ncbi:MAG: TIR domain-containing protein [Candidatus Kapaibacterium sp.]
MAAEVFISYSREDKDSVLALAKKLQDAGVSLWIDEGGIDGATMWGEEIVNALENAKVLLLMVTERSVNSHNVVKEVVLASEHKEHILPIHLEPTRIPSGLKYPLAGIQHIEYFQGDPDENLKTIIRSLERAGVLIKPPEVLATGGSPSTHSISHSMHSSDAILPPGALAVLPFDNISPEKETDYFSDGLTEELITSLSSLSEVEVVSRIVSMQYKGTKKDLKTIGRELEARYIVAGSIRKMGDNLRISAQLVDAETNRQLWAQTYKGKLDDIFDIQEQVGQQIADSLKLKLTLTEKIGLTKRATVNAQAYDLYLRGKDYLYQLTKRSVEYSIQLFETAIELDPRYAEAYAACSTAYGLLFTSFSRSDRLKEKAQELGFKALMYDNNSADAYASLSLSYWVRHQYDEAISAGKKALTLDPDNFLAFWTVGRIYYSTGHYQEARDSLEQSLRMRPDFYSNIADLELIYTALGETELAEAKRHSLREMLPSYLLRFPEDSRAHMVYAICLSKNGQIAEAKVQANKAVELEAGDPLMMYNCSCFFAQLGDVRESVKTLKDAIAAGYENYDWIERDSDLDPIRNDSEYIDLMKGR